MPFDGAIEPFTYSPHIDPVKHMPKAYYTREVVLCTESIIHCYNRDGKWPKLEDTLYSRKTFHLAFQNCLRMVLT